MNLVNKIYAWKRKPYYAWRNKDRDSVIMLQTAPRNIRRSLPVFYLRGDTDETYQKALDKGASQ